MTSFAALRPMPYAVLLAVAALPAQSGPRLFAEQGRQHLPHFAASNPSGFLSQEIRDVVIGDVDGDRDLDLVFGAGGFVPQGELNLLLVNDGSGVFHDATQAGLSHPATSTMALELADVDRDGDLDLIVGNCLDETTG